MMNCNVNPSENFTVCKGRFCFAEIYNKRTTLSAFAMTSLTERELTDLHKFYDRCRDNYTVVNMEYNTEGITFGPNMSFHDFLQIIEFNRDQTHWFGLTAEVTLILVYLGVILFGLFANGLMCFVILHREKMRTLRNLLVMNLCVSDMIMCLFCMPFTLVKLLLKNWNLGSALCKTVPWLQAVNVFVSTMTIMAICLDRYQGIVFPGKFKDTTKVKIVISGILGIWIFSGLIGFPLLFYNRVDVKDYLPYVSYKMCLEEWPSNNAKLIYTVVVVLVQFAIPICVLIAAHWQLCAHLKLRLLRTPTNTSEANRAMREATRHRRTSALLMAIAIMFTICWFPITVLNTLADFNYKMFMFQNFLMAFAVAHVVAMISTCLNPVIYGWFNNQFRREVKKTIFFWQRAASGERKPIMSPEAQKVVVYKTQTSYKAIQTDRIESLPGLNDFDTPSGSDSSPADSIKLK